MEIHKKTWPEYFENLDEELADIILLSSRIANNNNINLELAIIDKIENLKQRHDIK